MIELKEKDIDAYNKRLQDLLEQCLGEVKALGIPVTNYTIIIKTNTRAKTRFGCCRQISKGITRKYFIIEIAYGIKDNEDAKIKEVIIHELLHTCLGCQNHGKLWKQYASIINNKTDYSIAVTTKYEYFNLEKPKMSECYRYKIVCQKCGTTTYRKRKCRLVQYPNNYRCFRCGGSLKVTEDK